MTESATPADPHGFREAISMFASGVTVITSSIGARPIGMTASAVCSLSLDPILLLVCISRDGLTHTALESNRAFVVNVLGEGQLPLARHFATPGEKKFDGVPLLADEPLPVLADAIAHFVCDVRERFPGGDHSVFTGQVRRFHCIPSARPLVFFGRSFTSVESQDSALLRNWLDMPAAV